MDAYTFPENAKLSEAAKDLIRQILVLDPSKRPCLEQILAHDFFHQGNSIPKLLPTSTLACTPSLSYIRQFMPDANKDGIVNKPVKTKRLIDIPIKAKKLGGKSEIGNISEINIELKEPDIWVTKWVDYSSKYGLGYLLNNGFAGVFFNDSSKIILNPVSKEFFYIKRSVYNKKEISNSYNLEDYPKELQKKVTLLNHFKNYLEEEGNSTDLYLSQNKEKKSIEDENIPFIFIRKWMRTRHAIMFRLSNKIVQVCFQDKTEILVSSESRVVTYCNKKGKRMTYPLRTALEISNYEMTKRLKYTKDILTHMLTMNQQKNLGKGFEQGMVDIENNFSNKIENIKTIENEEDEIEENEEINDDDYGDNNENEIEEDEESEKDEEDEKSEENEVINIEFTSQNQLIKDFCISCDKTEQMSKIKIFLLKHNPQQKNKNIYFLGNGDIIDEHKTVEENKIKNNDVLMIIENYDFSQSIIKIN